VSYDVALDQSRVPRIRERVVDPGRKFTPLGPAPENLGDWAHSGVKPIPAPNGSHRFQLPALVREMRTNRPRFIAGLWKRWRAESSDTREPIGRG
jgi:hypothetical protein